MFNKNNNTEEISAPVEETIDLSTDISIQTTEDEYKTDGTVVLGTKSEDGTYQKTNATMPEKIDIEARKKQKLLEQNAKRKKATPKNLSKEAKKVQNIVAVVVLLLFIGVGSVFYYYKNIANNKDFTLKKVHVEYGEGVSLKITDYVNIKNPDEKLFTLDLSEFVADAIGEYKYKVTYSGKTKIGVIEVSDTKAPEVKIKDVEINVGDVYNPEMFINECKDFNSCYATFQDGKTVKTADTSGEQTVYLVIKDSVGNQVTKQAKLNVKSDDLRYLCTHASNYDYNLGYKTTISYDLTFDKSYNYIGGNLITIYEYIDNNDYLEYKNKNTGSKYSYDDNLSKVTITEKYTKGFFGNTTFDSISGYLNNQLYTCTYQRD